jgi:hypothetical protein
MNNRHRGVIRAFLVAGLLILAPLLVWADSDAVVQGDPPDFAAEGFRPVQRLLDLSGVVWMGGDTFLAVHDAKYPDELQRVRVSLLQLPSSLDGIQWKPLHPRFPGRPSSDLESAARIPGTEEVLLVESGDDASGLERIYRARVGPRDVDILDAIEWSSFTPVYNVEGTAVAQTDNGYLFIWAERADGQAETLLQWTDLSLAPFAIGASGEIGSALLTLPADLATLYSRPLVGIDVDRSGKVYTVAAYDPDSDNGPFRSAVLAIGQVANGGVILDPEPTFLGVLDGLKVEGIAIREEGDTFELFVGTDDENYGGALRPLP